MKLCIHCKHYHEQGRFADEKDVCHRNAKPGRTCPVTGELKITGYIYGCHTERWLGECGEEGKYWEKKTPVLDLSKPRYDNSIKEGLKLKNCPMPSHHPTCDCNGEGGDR